MMTMAAHQLGPSGAATAMDAAAYQRAAAAAWYIDPATRAAGYTTNPAAAAVAAVDHGIGGMAGNEAHLGHNVAASAPVPPPPGHPVGAAAPPPPDGSAAFFASSEASRYYQMHQAYENAASQGTYERHAKPIRFLRQKSLLI